MTQQFFLAQDDARGALALARQLMQAGVEQRGLVVRRIGALLVYVYCAHIVLPVVGTSALIRGSPGSNLLVPGERSWSQMFCRSPFGSRNTELTISASIRVPSASGANTRSPMRFKPPLTRARAKL